MVSMAACVRQPFDRVDFARSVRWCDRRTTTHDSDREDPGRGLPVHRPATAVAFEFCGASGEQRRRLFQLPAAICPAS
jgi:hypothetical protein